MAKTPLTQVLDQRRVVRRRRNAPVRLYQKVARHLLGELAEGKHPVGSRLPAERDLATTHGVSRPAVREAILALEVLGFVEVRIGSGAYVIQLPDEEIDPRFAVSAFELMEARVLFEGEAAALAALHITDEEIEELEHFVALIESGNNDGSSSDDADEAFHVAIARASRNKAVERMVRELWHMRSASPECALLLDKARTANVRPVVKEHRAIVEALREGDTGAARDAMREHLSAVIEHLLFSIEGEQVAETRRKVASTRERFAQSLSL